MKTLKIEVIPLADVVGKPDAAAGETTGGNSAAAGKSQRIAAGVTHGTVRSEKKPRRARVLRGRTGGEANRG